MEWWRTFYDKQHEVWPAWSESETDSLYTVAFLTSFAEIIQLSRILDLGCGTGREACGFGLRGHSCVGLDVSEQLIAKSRERAENVYVNEMVSFEVADYRGWKGDEPFDLIMAWDSALNIFSLAEWREFLPGLVEQLSPGGSLVINQLNREYWDREPHTVTLESDEIGPGRSERSYSFDAKSGLLTDRITWFPPDGEPVTLPEQRLYIPTGDELIALMGELGLRDVRLVGMKDGKWEYPPTEPPATASPSVALRDVK